MNTGMCSLDLSRLWEKADLSVQDNTGVTEDRAVVFYLPRMIISDTCIFNVWKGLTVFSQ